MAGKIDQEIIKASKSHDPITESEAAKIFEIVWKETKEKLRNKMKSQTNIN